MANTWMQGQCSGPFHCLSMLDPGCLTHLAELALTSAASPLRLQREPESVLVRATVLYNGSGGHNPSALPLVPRRPLNQLTGG